jgi:hypothetical protein
MFTISESEFSLYLVRENFILVNMIWHMSIAIKLFLDKILSQYGYTIEVSLRFGSIVCWRRLRLQRHVKLREILKVLM